MSAPRRKKLYVVRWTWNQHEIVPTKKAGMEKLKEWKAAKEAEGWQVRASRGGDHGYVAYAPDYELADFSEFGPDSKLHACLLWTYDAETKERIYPELPPSRSESEEPKPRPASRPRKGRKPIGA
jgi:hypothetical protein